MEEDWSVANSAELDSVRLPPAVRQEGGTFSFQIAHLHRTRVPGTRRHQEEVVKPGRSPAHERRILRITQSAGAKERWGLSSSRGSTTSQSAHAATSLQIRDVSRLAADYRAQRLDDLCGSGKWVLSHRNSPILSTVSNHRDQWRSHFFQSSSLRPFNRAKGVHKVHEACRRPLAKTWRENASISGRQPIPGGRSINSGQNTGIDRTVVPRTGSGPQAQQRGLDSNPKYQAFGHRNRYCSRPFLGPAGETQLDHGCCKVNSQLRVVTSKMGARTQVGKSGGLRNFSFSGVTSGANSHKVSVRRHSHQSFMEQRRKTLQPSVKRSAIFGRVTKRTVRQGNLATKTFGGDSHRCIRHRLGSSAERLGPSTGVLLGTQAELAHHGEGVVSSFLRFTAVQGRTATKRPCSNNYRQHVSESSTQQVHFGKPAPDGNISKDIGVLSGARSCARGRVHTLSGEQDTRFSFTNKSCRRVVGSKRCIPVRGAGVRKKNHRPVCRLRQQAVRKILQPYSASLVTRGRIRPRLEQREKLDLSPICDDQSSRQATHGAGRRGLHHSTVLDSSPVVSNAQQHGRLFAGIAGYGKSRGSEHGNSGRGVQKQTLETGSVSRAQTGMDQGALLTEAEDMIANSIRPTTKENYHKIHQRYSMHCTDQHVSPHPVSWQSVASFAMSLKRQGLKPRTIKSYISAVLRVDKQHGHDIPSALIKRLSMLYSGIENDAVQQTGAQQLAPAMSADVIMVICQKIYSLRTAELRSMEALIVFGFLFALRASTLVVIKRQHIKTHGNKLEFEEVFRKSKRPQASRLLAIDITQCTPARVLYQYFSSFGTSTSDAFAFEYLNSVSQSSTCATKVSIAIDTVLQELSIPASQPMTSHCLRRGAAVSMHALGVSLPRILAWGAWSSEQSLKPYLKDRAWTQASTSDAVCFNHLMGGNMSHCVDGSSALHSLHGCTPQQRKNRI